jgi:hypothetical protein
MHVLKASLTSHPRPHVPLGTFTLLCWPMQLPAGSQKTTHTAHVRILQVMYVNPLKASQ